MSGSKHTAKRVTLRKKAAAEAKATLATTPRLGSYRERLDWIWICARIRGSGVPGSDVDEVAQIVVIAMSQREQRKKLVVLPGQTERDARRTVLRAIIRHKVANYRRAKARFYRLRLKLAWSRDTEEITSPSAEELSLRKERGTQLHAALERMKQMAGVYQVVILNGLEEMPMPEVMATLDIPKGTAHSRMRRGKQVLREALEEEEAKEHAA